MINRDNWQAVKRFLAYRDRVMQNSRGTIGTYWQSLRHLLEWSDKNDFRKAPRIIPTFPEYMTTARTQRHPNENITDSLNPKYIGKVLSHARIFFLWARVYEPGYPTAISEAWVQTLRPKRALTGGATLQKREYWRLEDVETIARFRPSTLVEQRTIAATCFLFLSGMRLGAFITLPFKAVDMQSRKVYQLPELGVKTKNTKAAITFLLPIPSLLSVVEEWHFLLSTQGIEHERFYWYANIANSFARPIGQFADAQELGKFVGKKRSLTVYQNDLKQLCEAAGVEYKSPHKLRHGHGVWGVKHAKNIAQLKAISQNLMHANIGITDGIYGRLAEDDLEEIIAGFGQ
ncbi:MAG: tyrosine-type recombinase/integrase [Anaerolineales bacterium]|nr:tyrosine-type recombinase/integrase [Anaerolineales bacterium]